MGKTSAAVKNRYNSKVYERIHLFVKFGTKELIQNKALELGISVNAYIRQAIQDKYEADTGIKIEF